jgi:hypothetical protein
MYLLIAYANDAALVSSIQQIGVVNADKSVTTIATIDWSSTISSIYTIFAGNWFTDNDGSVCFFSPVSTTSVAAWTLYYSCVTSLTPSGATLTTPIAISQDLTNAYDPRIYRIGSTYYLIQTLYSGGNFGAANCISTATAKTGPYTKQSCSTDGGTALSALNYFSEGPAYFRSATSASAWEFYSENINSGQRKMYYSTCPSLALTSCTIATPVPWTMDQNYRHGIVTRTPFGILPAALGLM